MTSRVGRLLESQQEFVADASHQLRTPLTGIRLQLEELRETRPDGDARAAALDAGMREVDRLVAHRRRAADPEPGRRARAPRRASRASSRLASRAVERWRKPAAERGIDLRLESGGDPPPAWAAVPDLDRALDALVENAIVYSPAGGDVVVAVGSDGRIDVLDRGPGSMPGEEKLVFERFARGRVGREGAPGTGLGLAIARELAGQWGGARRAVKPRRRRDPRDARLAGSRDGYGDADELRALDVSAGSRSRCSGLAIAAAVALAASRLVSQRIGLASQPLDAGRSLAPPGRARAPARQRRHHAPH